MSSSDAKAGGAGAAAATAAFKKKMHVSEALKILNIEKESLTSAILEEHYKKYFAANDPAKGGSFYLQSKIFRAKEAIDADLKAREKPVNSTKQNDTPTENRGNH